MVTAEQVKKEIIKQNEVVYWMIGRYKALFENEGDLKYLERVQFLERVIDQNRDDLESIEFGKVETKELQSLYNGYISRNCAFQSMEN